MSVDVGVGEPGTNRWSTHHRGSTLSISIDQPSSLLLPRASESNRAWDEDDDDDDDYNTGNCNFGELDLTQVGLRSRHALSRVGSKMATGMYNSPSYFLEHEEPGDCGSVVPKSRASRMMQVESTDDGCMMIPLMSLSTPSEGGAIIGSMMVTESRGPVGGEVTAVPKSNQRRARFFQRALSCDVDNRLPAGGATSAVDALGTNKWDVPFHQGNALEGDESVQRSVNSSCTMPARTASFAATTEEVSVDSRALTASCNKDSGIVCSDEDLRSILSEVTLSRRMSAEAKRERMKSNRSLSLDSSSFFKLHIRRLQADSPYWLSRILSQRERRESGGCSSNGSGIASGNAGSGQCTSPSNTGPMSVPGDDHASAGAVGNGEASRRRAVLQSGKSIGDAAGSSYTISEVDVSSSTNEDGDQQSDPATSRRASTVSACSDDECSLLLVQDSGTGSSGKKHGNTNPCGVIVSEPPLVKSPSNGVPLSKVVWNESSVVDAELFGHAIEIYLTSVGSKNDAAVSSSSDGGGGVVLPMVSTLKGLFVK